MATVYATVEDIGFLCRSLTVQEREKAEELLPVACAKLRIAAKKYGKDIDSMIETDEDILLAVKEIVSKAVVRAIDSFADNVPSAASQSTQTALGYSLSMTYLNAGQSLYFLRNELKELGITRQRFGALEVFDIGDDKGN